MSKELKVGVACLVGIIVFFFSYFFLNSLSIRNSTYEITAVFDNMEKMDTGALVRLSGFKIGNVEKLELTDDSKVKVVMRINKEINIPKDSTCVSTAGAILGEMFIKVIPGKSKEYLSDKDSISTFEQVSFDNVTNNVNDLLILTKSSLEKINEVLDNRQSVINAMNNLDSITDNVKDVTEKANYAMDDATVTMKNIRYITGNANEVMALSKKNIIISAENIKLTTDRTASISKSLDVFVSKDAIPQTKLILDNANKTLVSLNDTVLTAKELIESFNDKKGSVDDLLAKADKILTKTDDTIGGIDSLIQSLTKASETVDSTMSSVNGLISDEDLRNDIKETASNINETTKEAKELVRSINKRFGSGDSDSDDKSFNSRVSAEGFYNSETEKFRLDTYADIYSGRNGFKFGLNDLGESNKFTLQYGRKLNNNNNARVGLFNSKLGVGYDFNYQRFGISADLYDPNSSKLYLRGNYMFTPGVGVYLGIDDLIDRNNRNLMFGLNFEK